MVSSRQQGPVQPVTVTSHNNNRGYDNTALQVDSDALGDSTVAINLEDVDNISQGGPAKPQPAGENTNGTVAITTEDNNDDGDDDEAGWTRFIVKARRLISKTVSRYWWYISRLIGVILLILYHIYLIYATYRAATSKQGVHFCDGVGFLDIITAIAYVIAFYYLVLKPAFSALIESSVGQRLLEIHWRPFVRLWNFAWSNKWVRLAALLVALLAILVYLIVDTKDERSRMVSAFGVVVFIFLSWISSHSIGKVVWRHVLWGLALQLVFGILILRVELGQQTFQCIGNKVNSFLSYTDEGSKFVFGFLVSDHFVFAFEVLPVIIFFGFSIQLLYYYGVMHVVITKIGWLLQVTVGTTACESLNAAANIFIGQTEAPLLIKPYISRLTRSEIHAIMTGGFATIAGSVLAAYIRFGVSPSHLLSASVMSAPAALAVSKLVYPETERSITTASDIKFEKGEEVNALDAASRGAMTVVKMCGYIAASLIAFIAFVAFVNGVLGWLGELVGFSEVSGGKMLTFELIASWIFRPAAWLMGVPWAECGHVGELIALKTILNEFVAYAKLREMIAEGLLSARSNTIATYALCGFSNLGAIGIQISGLSAMAPERRSDFARLAFSAMIAGNVACFMTACVAGALISDPSSVSAALVETVTNSTAI